MTVAVIQVAITLRLLLLLIPRLAYQLRHL
jgi:hypothetical protein